MNEPIWIMDEAVATIHQMVLAEHGGLSGVRDEFLLSSALAKPKQLFTYKDDVSIFDLATSYSFGIAKNHPFVDGNKRTAFTTAAIFLELNGYNFNAPEAEVVVCFENLAAGSIGEEELAAWFERSCNLP